MSASAAPRHDDPHAFRRDFVDFAIRTGVLKFGEFQTKAGRLSPYFFNSGLFNDGASLRELSGYYAQAALASGIGFDLLFGPAYKGITLAAGTAMALAALGHNVPYSFNRKEAKDHGEGGNVVGAPLRGRVLIVDDVITAGTSVRESVEIIRAAGATPAGVLIAVDRQERGKGELSAAQEVSRDYGIRVSAIATLQDILATLEGRADQKSNIERIEDYRRRYGAPA
jgi:orotate phosphoribosyltransferase